MKTDAKNAAAGPRKYRPYAWLGGALLLLVLVVVMVSPRRRVAPQELIGVWTTSDPTYRDRFMAINSGTVSFGTGDGTVTTGFIRNVEETSERGELVYSLTYTTDDGEQELSVSFEPANGFLRFSHQPGVVWKKSGPV